MLAFEEIVKKIEHAIATGNLPGADAQYKMAAMDRKNAVLQTFQTKPHRVSAVLILLYPQQNGASFPLTLRHSYKGAHGGQVSLPGGKAEAHDPSLSHTALRETEEEIGVPQKDVTIIGQLTDLYIPPSNFHVHPYVGFVQQQPIMKKDDFEVAELFSCSIETLLQEQTLSHTKVLVAEGLRIKTPYFNIENKIVWGATAMILSELKEILKS